MGAGAGSLGAGGQALSPARPCSPQPCLPGAQFRCPVAFQREILVRVTGTVELVGEIKVALPVTHRRACGRGVGGLRGGAGGALLGGGFSREVFLHFLCYLEQSNVYTLAGERQP